MTMMMTNSQFGLEDMEALLWGPSSPMADPMHLLSFHPDQEEEQKGGGTSLVGDTSPVSPLASSTLSSSSSPPPFYSPPPSPPAVLLPGDKAGTESDLLSLPWLGEPGQLRRSVSDGKEDMFSDLDWMAERVDLSEFDLDSLMGSCSPHEESPSSPDDLLASLDCPMELESLPVSTELLPAALPPSLPSSPLPPVCAEPETITVDEAECCIDDQDVPSSPLIVPEPQEELEIKSEPVSPDPSSPDPSSPDPSSPDPSSPVYTLDLGSEVDVSESEVKPVVTPVLPQVQRLVLSLSPTPRIVLVLAPKKEVSITTVATMSSQTPCRSRPYPQPAYTACPPSTSAAGVKIKGASGEEKPTFKAPKVKKLKKMEQNKTAATRYRQKKRAEQDALLDEHTLLERKNMELTEKAESMAREIEYLKELMEEVRSARTVKGLSADP
ncbi:activating transcription factor 4b isoform X3 [Notolabrus celidotus]|uniref:activating transcription factor 4b isoform X2 n=1 Tax=Notolabrus celidotus TaxID=1203425 RepID=UPI0014906BA8|nr:activating transcription factor 4b isoform X2 [Notolabrus celidotus]XP_034534919.1 activating transcription factor 4b isoform X3 [Notolabrus celidotus]